MIGPVRHVAAMVLVVITAASCTSIPPGSAVPEQSICNGIPSDMGGCTPGRHTFTGSSCTGLAVEWASVLDKAVIAVLDGPENVNAQARSVRLRQALVITTSDMNMRLQALKLEESCDLPEFMAAAEPVFTAKLRGGVGAALFDGSPATYQDWLNDVGKVIRSIDEGESPLPSTP